MTRDKNNTPNDVETPEPDDGAAVEPAQAPGEAEELSAEKYQAAVDDARQNYDRFLRVSAEFENYKKRQAREMADFRKYANEALLKELLSGVDNLQRALVSARGDHENNDSLMEGVDMILGETLKIFEKFGVTPIESLGKLFDPAFHQAVFQQETDDYPANTVVDEIQKGYLLHDRLLRPAMVVVSKSPETAQEGAGQAQAND